MATTLALEAMRTASGRQHTIRAAEPSKRSEAAGGCQRRTLGIQATVQDNTDYIFGCLAQQPTLRVP